MVGDYDNYVYAVNLYIDDHGSAKKGKYALFLIMCDK